MKKLSRFIVLIIFICSINSCEKTEIDNAEFESELSIVEARNWLENRQPETLRLKSGQTNIGGKEYKPDWQFASVSCNQEVDVVEVYIASAGSFGFASRASLEAWFSSGDHGYLTSLTKLVLMRYKESGEIVSFLMTIIGDMDYLENKCFILWENSYLQKDANFSGQVLFHSLDGKYENGWRYLNGEVTHKVEMGTDLNTAMKLKSAMVCEGASYTGWYETCTDWYSVGSVNGVLDWENATYTHTTCEIETTDYNIIECMLTTGDESTGGGGTPGGYDPPGEFDPSEDCNCPICPECRGCVAILKSTGSDGCPMCSCPEVDKTGLEQNEKADCIYEKLMSGSVINNFMSRYFGLTEPIHSFLGELDLHWVVDDLSQHDNEDRDVLGLTSPIGASTNPNYHIRITIDSEHVSTHSISAIAYTMLHEAAHAKLIGQYYDEMGTTDFNTLFIEHNNLYGAEAQHFEMYMDSYISQLAQGVKDFDDAFGLNRDLLFYKKAISYQLRTQLGLTQGSDGLSEFNQLFDNSPKTCE